MIDINKYKVFKQRDGSITYARLWKGHILPNGGLYEVHNVNMPTQWRALNQKKHHKIIGKLKRLVKEEKIKVEPVTGNWENIEVGDNLKSIHLTRWFDGSWANIIPEEHYYKVQELKKLFWIGLFCMIVVVGSLA